MRSINAVFPTRQAAEEAVARIEHLVPKEQVCILSPGSEEEIERLPTNEDMRHVGGPLGGILGGSLGFVSGLLLPGIGPIIGLGVAAGALLGALSAYAGYKVGDRLDRFASTGVPIDALPAFREALSQGLSVVVVLATHPDTEPAIHHALDAAGAATISPT